MEQTKKLSESIWIAVRRNKYGFDWIDYDTSASYEYIAWERANKQDKANEANNVEYSKVVRIALFLVVEQD